jgi:CubicO group peptidase (beta-lactamase class C family)
MRVHGASFVGMLCLALLCLPVAGQTNAPAVEVPPTPAGKLLSLWLDVINSGDKDRVDRFFAEHREPDPAEDPAERVRRVMRLREETGGFDLKSIEKSSETEIVGTVQEKNAPRKGRFTLRVSDKDAARIKDFRIELIEGPPPPAPAREPLSQLFPQADAQLSKLAADDQFSGAVLVAKDGKILWEKAYGLANRETKTPNTVNTRFRLGSMNKMFTSVAIAQLVEQGKLKFTDTLASVLPDYPNQEVARKVTVEELLTHRSGLGDYFGPEFDKKRDSLRALRDYVPLFAGNPLYFEPGTDWRYSNAGFLVLGLIIEKLSGQTYYDYVQKHIYDVAGMTNSGSPPAGENVPNQAVGYTRGEESNSAGPLRPNTAMLPWRGGPAGGGDSTVEDLLKFDQALRNNKLLTPEMTRLVTTGKVHPPRFPENMKYAYGFGDTLEDGRHIVGHSGGAEGMNAELDMHIESGYTVVVLANRDPMTAVRWAEYLSARLPIEK